MNKDKQKMGNEELKNLGSDVYIIDTLECGRIAIIADNYQICIDKLEKAGHKNWTVYATARIVNA